MALGLSQGRKGETRVSAHMHFVSDDNDKGDEMEDRNKHEQTLGS